MEDEIDGKDEAADHFLLMKTQPQEIVGTIRWWPSPDRTYSKLGRLAVLKPYRGLGAGRLLVKALEEHIASGKGKSGAAFAGKKEILVVANSQAYAEQFYAKLGYTREGEPFIEDGDPHVRMTKTIPIS